MARRRPLTPQQLAEIREAAKRGPDGKPLEELMRGTIKGTATAPEPASPTRSAAPGLDPRCRKKSADDAERLLDRAGESLQKPRSVSVKPRS